jgi:hypothetical protein
MICLLTYLHAMVDFLIDDESMMINEIDYVDDELNVNEQYSDERIIDHRNNHFVNDENSPI